MHIAFALPTPAETGGGGGADYIDGMAAGLRHIGVKVDVLLGRDPVFPPEAISVVDGMLLPLLHHRIDALGNAVALVHHVASASGRDAAANAEIRAIEQIMLPRLRRVVATSAAVAERLAAAFGITADAVPPGTRDHPPAAPDPAAPIILSVGVLTRRKGHERVIRAAARLLDLPWHLVVAGDTQRDPAHLDELRALVVELGLADRVSIHPDPAPDALERAWRRATILALATRWEGYPVAVADAMQRGIPVLVTTGANAETILPLSAGAICPFDDMATFGKCLRRLLFDDDLRADMASAARTAGQALPRWPDRARAFQLLLEQSA